MKPVSDHESRVICKFVNVESIDLGIPKGAGLGAICSKNYLSGALARGSILVDPVTPRIDLDTDIERRQCILCPRYTIVAIPDAQKLTRVALACSKPVIQNPTVKVSTESPPCCVTCYLNSFRHI